MTVWLSALRRVPVVGWVAIVVAIAAAVTAWQGGFERHSGRWLGPEMALGEPVDTRFWDVTVLDGHINAVGPWLEVDVEITNKTSQGARTLTSYMLFGRVAEPRTNLDFSYCDTDGERPYNPGVTVTATCQFRLVEDATLDVEGIDELPVTISVLDQRMTDALLSGQQPIISSPAGQYNFSAPVTRR